MASQPTQSSAEAYKAYKLFSPWFLGATWAVFAVFRSGHARHLGDLGVVLLSALAGLPVYDISGWVGFTSLSHIPLKMLAEDQLTIWRWLFPERGTNLMEQCGATRFPDTKAVHVIFRLQTAFELGTPPTFTRQVHSPIANRWLQNILYIYIHN